MSDTSTEPLTPATGEDLIQALIFALTYDRSRRAVREGDKLRARVAAERLVEYLQRSGFVVMKKPEAPAPDVTTDGTPHAAEPGCADQPQ